MLAEITAPEVVPEVDEEVAEALLDWFEGDAQDIFNIDEGYSLYSSPVNPHKIAIAAECYEGYRADGNLPPGTPEANDATAAYAVREAIRRWGAWEKREQERREYANNWQQREADRLRMEAEVAAIRARNARRAEVYHALLRPDSGACESERQQAREYLGRLGDNSGDKSGGAP